MRPVVTYLLAVAAFSGRMVPAQSPFEYADQRTHVVHYSAVTSQAGGWTIGGSAGGETGVNSYGFATHFTANGDTVWSALANGFPTALVNAVGDRVLVCGPVNGCDVGPWNWSFLMSVAADGSTDWMKEYVFWGAHGLSVSQAGTIAVLGTDSVMIANSTGDSLTSWPASAGVQQVFWETDTTLLLASDLGVERRDAAGTLLTSAVLPANTTGVAFMADHLVTVRYNGTLYVWDNAFNATDTIPLGSSFTMGHLIPVGDSLIAVSDDNIILLDSAWSIVSSDPWDALGEFQDLLFLDAAVTADELGLVGSHNFNSRYTGIIRTTDLDGNGASHPIDVGIEIASVDSVWYTGAPPIIHPRALVSIHLSNQGAETVDDVVLNAFFGGWFCSDAGITSRFENLQLAPGADTVLTGIEPVLSYGPVEYVQHQDFCIAALSPNNLLDRNLGDNLACDSVHITIGIEDIAGANAEAFIPNPCSDQLEVRFSTTTAAASRLWLFDPTGRVLMERVVPIGTERLALDVSALASGPLLLRLEGPGWTLARTVVHLGDRGE